MTTQRNDANTEAAPETNSHDRVDANETPGSSEHQDEARRLTTAAGGGAPEPQSAPSLRAPRRAKVIAAALAVLSVIAIGVSAAFLLMPGESPANGSNAPTPSATTSVQKDDASSSADDASAADAKQDAAQEGEAPVTPQDQAPASAGAPQPEAPQGTSSQPSASAQGSSAPASPAPTPTPRPNTVSVSVSIDSSIVGNPVSASASPTFQPGATPYDALMACGVSVNASSGPMGIYVSAIGGLAEKEHGGTSGWKYSVNGVTPSVSCSAYTLSDGDSVVWYYVLSA